jgi:hypothetical protein
MSTPSIKGPSNTGVPTSQPETPPSTSGSNANSSTSSTPTAQETKSSQQLATAKKEEFGLTMITSKLNNAFNSTKETILKEVEIKKLTDSAEASGVEKLDRDKFAGHLRKMDYKKFEGEAKFLKENVLSTPNTDRALLTYNELKTMQDQHPDQLQDKHVQLLTKGVAQPRATYITDSGERTPYPTGAEGVLGQDGAKKTAEALIGMSPTDHQVINNLLDEAGKKEGKNVSGGNPDLEKVLILKAAGAHHEALTNPSNTDKAWSMAGEPTSKMVEIASYAKDIRGERGKTLARESTSIDPYLGENALQQRWTQSCGPTTTQGMKAEIDPMYARNLHKDFIHDVMNSTDAIADEQKQMLVNEGLTAVPRGSIGGQPALLQNILNSEVNKYTGVTYSYTPINPPTPANRAATLNQVAEKLKAGVDVPINSLIMDYNQTPYRIKFEHFMYLTDVRGTVADQQFLLTDPWEGKTVWLTRQQLVSGRTKFPIGEGQFGAAYY